MSLINDALKEAKARSAHSALPPDVAERMQHGEQAGEGGETGPRKPAAAVTDPAPESPEATPAPEDGLGPGTVPPEEPLPVETVAGPVPAVDDGSGTPGKSLPATPEMRRKFHLSAIVGSASRHMAVINGDIVQAGDSLDGVTILSISRRQLIVEKDGAQYVLRPSSGQ